MKTRIALFCALLAAASLPAQNYYLATQQAKRASAQNDAEQQRIQNAAGGAPAQSAPAAPAPGAPPTDPALQATLNNISSLQSDFAALSNFTGDKPDPAQKISLLNNLSSAAQGTRASSDSIKKLADSLLTAVSGKKKLAAAQQKQLAGYIHAAFNSSHLTAAQQQMIFDGVQKILTDGGASSDDAVNVVTDLKKVAAETK